MFILHGGGNYKTSHQEVTLQRSFDDTKVFKGTYSIIIDWPDSDGKPDKWGPVNIINPGDGGNICTFPCDDEGTCLNGYPDHEETPVGDGQYIEEKYVSVTCNCE